MEQKILKPGQRQGEEAGLCKLSKIDAGKKQQLTRPDRLLQYGRYLKDPFSRMATWSQETRDANLYSDEHKGLSVEEARLVHGASNVP